MNLAFDTETANHPFPQGRRVFPNVISATISDGDTRASKQRGMQRPSVWALQRPITAPITYPPRPPGARRSNDVRALRGQTEPYLQTSSSESRKRLA